MPELPEVETVKRVLKRQLIGLQITDIKINYEKMILNDINYFKNKIINKTFKDIKRKGKALIFEFEDAFLVSHLRMEGKYFYKEDNEPILKHEHIVFYLNNKMTLRYHDTRKFGIMVLKENVDLYTTPPLSLIGPEPWDINVGALYNILLKTHIPIKTALLDQQIMSGLGNIYVDEVLFLAKINPHRIASNVTEVDVENIIKYSKEVLSKSIEYGGTTIRSYTSSLGVSGNYQQFLLVHTKEICPVCKLNIIKDKTNGRGTYYCSNCQKY